MHYTIIAGFFLCQFDDLNHRINGKTTIIILSYDLATN